MDNVKTMRGEEPQTYSDEIQHRRLVHYSGQSVNFGLRIGSNKRCLGGHCVGETSLPLLIGPSLNFPDHVSC
jgi:hypothetical protein